MGEKPDLQQQILNELRKNKSELQNSITTTSKSLEAKVDKLNKSVLDTNAKLDDLVVTVSNHSKRLAKVETKIAEIDTTRFDLDNFTDKYKESLEIYNKNTTELKNRITYLETENRKGNLVITGIPELAGEDRSQLAKNITNILNDVVGVEVYIKPYQVYRRGVAKEGQSRRVVIKLNEPQLKIELLRQGYKLAGSKIYLSPDFTPEQEKARFFLRQYLKQNGNGKGKFISNFIIQIESQKFYYNEVTNDVEPKE